MLRNITSKASLASTTTRTAFCLASAVSFSSFRLCSSASSNVDNSSSSTSSSTTLPATHRAQPGPYKKVGNLFIVHCSEIPAKFTPQVNLMLRELRLEFRGSFVFHPDTPAVRERLFRARHVVSFELIPLDEVKEILGVPEHVDFCDLEAAGLNHHRPVGAATAYPYLKSMHQFLNFRKDRMKEIIERDQVEKRLLKARKRQFASSASTAENTTSTEQ